MGLNNCRYERMHWASGLMKIKNLVLNIEVRLLITIAENNRGIQLD